MLLRSCRRDEELDVAALGRHRRATRSTVDTGGLDSRDEASVEPAVAALGRPVALLVVEDHDAIVAEQGEGD